MTLYSEIIDLYLVLEKTDKQDNSYMEKITYLFLL